MRRGIWREAQWLRIVATAALFRDFLQAKSLARQDIAAIVCMIVSFMSVCSVVFLSAGYHRSWSTTERAAVFSATQTSGVSLVECRYNGS